MSSPADDLKTPPKVVGGLDSIGSIRVEDGDESVLFLHEKGNDEGWIESNHYFNVLERM